MLCMQVTLVTKVMDAVYDDFLNKVCPSFHCSFLWRARKLVVVVVVVVSK